MSLRKNIRHILEGSPVTLSSDFLSTLAKKLVEKYPKPEHLSSMANMGSAILFSTEAGVVDVRNWLNKTKFQLLSARKYLLKMPEHNIEVTAEIENQTYGMWAVQLTGVRIQ